MFLNWNRYFKNIRASIFFVAQHVSWTSLSSPITDILTTILRWTHQLQETIYYESLLKYKGEQTGNMIKPFRLWYSMFSFNVKQYKHKKYTN